ncbi:MAG: hypothetical protein N3D18_07400 [Roseococcus sp.]|nr:hypothetical protein [Roseococcus sp.]
MSDDLFSEPKPENTCALWDALIRDEPRARFLREQIQRLWSRFRPFATNQFRKEFPSRTHHRLWEMALTVALLEQGLPLEPQPDAAPDLGFLTPDGRRVWIEAACVTPGADGNPDQVPVLRPAMEVGIAQRFPEERILLRLLETIDRKRAQRRRHLAAGRVSIHDAYVIALNIAHAQEPVLWGAQHLIVKAAFGLGRLVLEFDPSLGRTVAVVHEERPHLVRAKGRPISSSLFLDDEAAEVSALLCSDFHAGRLLAAPVQEVCSEMVCVHNPFASVRLKEGCLGAGHEYVAVADGAGDLRIRRVVAQPGG